MATMTSAAIIVDVAVEKNTRPLDEPIPDIQCRLGHEQHRGDRDDEDEQIQSARLKVSNETIQFHAGYTTCMNSLNRRILTLILCHHASPRAPARKRRKRADLVVTDARVWTGNAEQPWAEAVASRGDDIVAVGSNAEIER